MQAKLLRVLQERTFEPLGSVDPVEVDVRVVAATNQNLQQLVRDGTFRQDLYYRINIVRLQLPALRDRREDIPLLVEHFIGEFNRLQDRHIVGVSEEVMAVLFKHDFPGNIRELENVIEHAFVLCRGPLIQLQHLPPELYGSFESRTPAGGGLTLKALEEMYISEALRRHQGNRAAAARELGINPSTLFRKIKSLNIEVPDSDGRSRDRSSPTSSDQKH
jgi:transcriptional regulator with PAS, ATPase and Fis domain